MRPITAATVALALALALAACGDDGGDDGAASPTAPSSTTTAPATTTTTAVDGPATTTTVVDDEEGIAEIETVLPTLLVSAEELGDPSFADVGWTPDEEACGSPTAVVGTSLASEALGSTVTEALAVHDGVDAAADAFGSCASGDDVTAEVGGDRAARDGDVFVAQVADVLVTVTVTGVAPGGSPDPVETAAFAVGKVIAFLEAGAGG